MDMSQFFKKIHARDHDILDINKKLNEKSRVFQLIRNGIDLNSYSVGDICITPWESLVYCSNLIVTQNETDSNISSIYLPNKTRNNYYRKYGAYDFLQFAPICGLLFTTKTRNPDSTFEYTDPGIIYNDNVYLYKSDFDKDVINLNQTDYFEDTSKSFCFDPIPVHFMNMKLGFSLNTTPIQFILIATGYSQIFNRDNYVKIFPTYTDINTIAKLRIFLNSTRSRFKDI